MIQRVREITQGVSEIHTDEYKKPWLCLENPHGFGTDAKQS